MLFWTFTIWMKVLLYFNSLVTSAPSPATRNIDRVKGLAAIALNVAKIIPLVIALGGANIIGGDFNKIAGTNLAANQCTDSTTMGTFIFLSDELSSINQYNKVLIALAVLGICGIFWDLYVDISLLFLS